MKNKPLAVQIWMMLAGTTLGIFFILFLALHSILKMFFTNETFNTIEDAQRIMVSGMNIQKALENVPVLERQQEIQNVRAVMHVLVTQDGQFLPKGRLPAALITRIRSDMASQTSAVQRYSAGNKDNLIHYMIRKTNISGRNITVVSYMWDTYQRELTGMLFRKLMLVMAAITALSWLPAFWMSKYLSGPLITLQRHVKRIADRDWKQKIAVDRRDEIGQLSESIERMRGQLVKQDELQQSLLQNISHDLKTPVMVIHSYAQSILDGMYPKGDLDGSVRVIESEAERLNKRIRDLLYLTKLDYLSSNGPTRDSVKLQDLISDAADRLRIRKPELEWRVELADATVAGDAGQLTVVFENLLDNQIRYARSTVTVAMRKDRAESGAGDTVFIRIGNDGPALEPDAAERMFAPFQKGQGGEFGLGLSIVQRIVALHQGKVWAGNEPDGVAFYVRLPTVKENYGEQRAEL